jgi:hypothetical protein
VHRDAPLAVPRSTPLRPPPSATSPRRRSSVSQPLSLWSTSSAFSSRVTFRSCGVSLRSVALSAFSLAATLLRYLVRALARAHLDVFLSPPPLWPYLMMLRLPRVFALSLFLSIHLSSFPFIPSFPSSRLSLASSSAFVLSCPARFLPSRGNRYVRFWRADSSRERKFNENNTYCWRRIKLRNKLYPGGIVLAQQCAERRLYRKRDESSLPEVCSSVSHSCRSGGHEATERREIPYLNRSYRPHSLLLQPVFIIK